MEKLLNPYDKECMKMAMLKHEETFKEQVYELHRLYQIQKMLMKSIETSTRQSGVNQKRVNTKNVNCLNEIDLECPASDHEEHIAESNGNVGVLLEIEDESQIELTLGPASYYRRRRKKSEIVLSHSDSAGWGFSSSSTGSSHMKRSSPRTHQMKDTSTEEFTYSYPPHQGMRSSGFDVEEQLRQDRLKQPWFFQALSLNMT